MYIYNTLPMLPNNLKQRFSQIKDTSKSNSQKNNNLKLEEKISNIIMSEWSAENAKKAYLQALKMVSRERSYIIILFVN